MPIEASVPSVARIRRDVVRAEGPDTITFLQGQVSQDIAGLAVGQSAWSFVLQPQGKVDAWVRVHRTGEESVAIDVDEGWGDAVLARLSRFMLRTKCELSVEPSVPVVATRGFEAPGGLACGWPGIEGSDVIGTVELPDELPPGTVDLGDRESYDALRIAFGVPALGAELTEATIPAEAGQWVIDASVSFTKGCFTGQELVARIDSRGGNVPRHLRVFTTEGQPPALGVELLVDGAAVGTVTSAAAAPDGGAVGLAYVKRAVEVPATARLGTEDGPEAQLVDVSA